MGGRRAYTGTIFVPPTPGGSYGKKTPEPGHKGHTYRPYGSGAAAVESVVRVRVGVFVDDCQVRLCDPRVPVCARVPTVCPGSPWCLFTGSQTPGGAVRFGVWLGLAA